MRILPVEPVLEWIRRSGTGWRILRFSRRTTTVDDAARALNIDRSLIVKTIIAVACSKTYAIIVPGDRRLDLDKLSRVAGCRARLAKPAEVEERTGYSVGGVPPVALPSDIVVIMDQSIAELDIAYGGGGEDGTLLEFSPKELIRLIKPILIPISR